MTPTLPLVSVIVPAYNQAGFLARALDSVLSQTWARLELVVVDDGSTDATPEVLRAYQEDARVRVLRQANAGVGAARNAGAAASCGELLCFLDADDYYAPDKVAAQVAQFARDPGLGFVYCDIETVDEQGAPCDPYRVAEQRTVLSGDILSSLLVGGYFPPHCVMLRRAVFEASGGFDPVLGGHADLELWMRLAADGVRAEFLPESLVAYRRHEGSMSHDVEHMRRTRSAALERVAARHPARIARALGDIQDLQRHLHAANMFLQQQLAPALAAIDPTPETWRLDLLERFGEAALTGAADAAAIWDVTLGGEAGQALLLHPPAALEFDLDEPTAGVIRGAVALHPDVWEKEETGPCRFVLDVDGMVRMERVVDPARSGDRRWLGFVLELPATTTVRRVTLRTEAIGSPSYRWALWRGLHFEPVRS